MSDARIYERGYRHYEGPRGRPSTAAWTLYKHSLARALGLRRTARAKILPILTLLMAYVPGIVFVGLAAFLPKKLARGNLPTYSEYYGTITAAIIVFVAFVAPEVLCPDRRNNILGLYLASPLTRDSYVAAKAAAVATVIAGVTLGPPLLLVVTYTLEGYGPSVAEMPALYLRIVAAGVFLMLFATALSLAGASLTDRRGFASTGIILAISLSGAATGVLHEQGTSAYVLLANLNWLPFEVVQRIYGQPGDQPSIRTLVVFAAALAWTVLGAAVLLVRYRRLEVTR